MKALVFRRPARLPILAANDIHIFGLSLTRSREELELLYQALDPGERHRASQFRFAKDRDRYIAARGLMKQILSLYLQPEPTELRLHTNDFGKPEFPGEISFNYSHSHDLGVFAVARAREVGIGIDVERIEPGIAEESIPEAMFSPAETATIRALPRALQPEAFFFFWTRKEAYAKARGEGLRIPLNSFDVSRDRVVVTGKCDLSLHSFRPAPDYVAAIAAEGQDWKPTFIECSEDTNGLRCEANDLVPCPA